MLPVCLAHTASLAPWLPGLGPCKGKLRSACICLTQIKGRGRGLQLEFHSEVHFLGEFQAESRSVTNTFDAVKRLVLVWKKPCIFSGKSEALSIFLGWGVGGFHRCSEGSLPGRGCTASILLRDHRPHLSGIQRSRSYLPAIHSINTPQVPGMLWPLF